jgi:hypothetical protein
MKESNLSNVKCKLELNMKDGCEIERTKERNSLENGRICVMKSATIIVMTVN